MRALLLHGLPPNLYSTAVRPLRSALESICATVDVAVVWEVSAEIDKGVPCLRSAEKIIPTPDVALTRVFLRDLKSVSDVLVGMGVPTVNDPLAEALAADKHRTSFRLAHAGLPVPDQVYLLPGSFQPEAIAARLGMPFIVKPLRGMKGRGVQLITTSADFEHLPVHDKAAQPVIAQQYIPEATQGDVRVVVAAGEPVASMRRVAAPGDHRANLHAGGAGHPYVLSEEEASVASAAAHTCGLDVAGVDLIPTDFGPVILEVNSKPGLQISEIASVDVPAAIAATVVAKARKNHL